MTDTHDGGPEQPDSVTPDSPDSGAHAESPKHPDGIFSPDQRLALRALGGSGELEGETAEDETSPEAEELEKEIASDPRLVRIRQAIQNLKDDEKNPGDNEELISIFEDQERVLKQELAETLRDEVRLFLKLERKVVDEKLLPLIATGFGNVATNEVLLIIKPAEGGQIDIIIDGETTKAPPAVADRLKRRIHTIMGADQPADIVNVIEGPYDESKQLTSRPGNLPGLEVEEKLEYDGVPGQRRFVSHSTVITKI